MLYPNSISNAVAMQCDIVFDTVIFPATEDRAFHYDLPLVLPIIFVNGGVRTAIVEWVAAKIVGPENIKLYTPVSLVDLKGFLQVRRMLHAENLLSQFSEFPVLPGQAIQQSILFLQEPKNTRYPMQPWSMGQYLIEVYVKYRDREVAILQKKIEVGVSCEMLQSYKSGSSIANSIRNIDI